ncbi:MAG: hypothetical protein H8K03_04440 [Nitrospira sp.]
MTRSRQPRSYRIRTLTDGARILRHGRDRNLRRPTLIGFLLIVCFSIFTMTSAFAEERVSPTLLAETVGQRADQFAPIDSDESAMTLFTTSVGPALGLKDAAGALRTKRLPSKMVKELGLTELSQTVYELMGALAAWQLADSLSRDAISSSTAVSLSPARQEWLRGRSRSAPLADLLRLTQEDQTLRTSQTTSKQQNTELLLAAERTVFEASQRATAAWWDIYGWKERIRQAKGQARLCGTWQWIVHNHQNHGEQKATITFPPAGQVPANSVTPTESIIVGDAIYLRWEQNGRIQEDSLLFIKDDAKIEGSFMNNTGGWGPISGKRLTGCQP